MKTITSASCSMAPDSRRSAITGRLSVRVSSERLSCDSAMTQLSQAKFFIDETPGLTPTDLRARARRLKREHNLGLIVVDYLQLMQVPGSSENRTNEISEISVARFSLLPGTCISCR